MNNVDRKMVTYAIRKNDWLIFLTCSLSFALNVLNFSKLRQNTFLKLSSQFIIICSSDYRHWITKYLIFYMLKYNLKHSKVVLTLSCDQMGRTKFSWWKGAKTYYLKSLKRYYFDSKMSQNDRGWVWGGKNPFPLLCPLDVNLGPS